MQKIIYTCNNCGAQAHNLSSWMEISGAGNSLSVTNNLHAAKCDRLEKFEAIHFCSSACLVSFFVNEPTSPTSRGFATP